MSMRKMLSKVGIPNLRQSTDRAAPRENNSATFLPVTSPQVKFNREDERLKTFENNWPVSFINPVILAKTGMYYTGLCDLTKCQFCDTGISSWEEGDDPVEEHKKWQPNCPLLKRQYTANIPIDQDSLNSILPLASPDICGGVNHPIQSGIEHLCCDVRNRTHPLYPHYAVEETRIASFKEWPKFMKGKVNKLAEAGLFYIGKGDQVQCFSCGGGLKDWEETDDPWEQHAIWHSNCKFLRLTKGKEFIEAAIAKHIKKNNEVVRPFEPDQPLGNDAEEAEPDKAADKICKICFLEERNTVFLPCGHVVACGKCALAMKHCPICRQPLQDVHRLYFP